MARTKKINKLILMVLLLVLVVGCSSYNVITPETSVDYGTVGGIKDNFNNSLTPSKSFTESYGDYEHTEVSQADTVKNPLEPKKVVTTVQMSYETSEFDKADNNLSVIIEKYNAYVENSSINNNYRLDNRDFRLGSYVIRVPKDKTQNFKNELAGIGNKVSESTSKEDVTKQYSDTESRLKVITVKEERILALLEKADKIENIITLENQLSNVILEKENLKSSLVTLDDKVDFSTFHISILEKEKLTTKETIETTFGMRVKATIKDTVYNFKKGTENMILGLISVSPLLIFIIVIGFIIYKKIKHKLIKTTKKEEL